jgi:23S rRNA (cytidine1920-2'-O)/16S rRNA (cytidine1409-2'-O)-methyltransferase
MPQKKKRLDQLLVEKGLISNRTRGRALIMTGKVRVNNQVIEKPGTLVSPTDDIFLKEVDMPYVSRGGLKLAEALRAFQINVTGCVCLDVGASTGGFSDCLLQHGAASVYAVDVGYGQLAWKLRQDSRVVVIERTNVRYLSSEAIPQPIDIITIDVSFISLKIVIPVVGKFMHPDTLLIALIKPQFEVGRGQVGKGGVVRDPDLHHQVNKAISDFAAKIGLAPRPVIDSPLLGPKGNKEFIILCKNKNLL